MKESTHKLQSLDSVRGIASFLVMWHHLVFGFEPAWKSESMASAPWVRISHHGELAVHIFFVLSGFVLSYSFVQSGKLSTLQSATIKRYWRLFIPVCLSIGISYILLATGAYANHDAARLMNQEATSWLNRWYSFNPSIGNAVKESIFDVFFNFDMDQSYNSNLWTMEPELKCSLFIFAFQALTNGLKNRFILYLVLIVIFQRLQNLWMIDFLVGAVICDLYRMDSRPRPLLPVLALLSIFAAGLTPIWLNSTFGVSLIPSRWLPYVSMLAAALVIAGVLWSPELKNVLSHRLFLMLGKMSFPLYLIHLLVECSIGCRTYIYVRSDMGASHSWGFAAASAMTILVSLALAWIGSFTIEPFSITASRWIYSTWFQPGKVASSETTQ